MLRLKINSNSYQLIKGGMYLVDSKIVGTEMRAEERMIQDKMRRE